jgi:transposase InsO family protein
MEVDRYRLPLPDDIFDAIGDSGVFTKLDMQCGFWQLPVHPDHVERLGMHWAGRGVHVWKRMPFGVHNAPQRWQQIMDSELARADCSDFAKAFVDDIIIFSKNPAEHIKHVTRVLEALHAVGLKAHPEKSLFGCEMIEYLGMNVSRYGLTPNEAKVAAIAALQPPQNVSQVRSVVGLMSYYRRFVPNFSAVAAPLNALLKKEVPFHWGEQQQLAFDELKRVLTTPGMALKRVNPELPLLLYSDWSKQGIGAVLAQIDGEGFEHICACASRSLNVHERNYVSFKGELLACVWATATFRQYLHGHHWTLITDHEPLVWLLQKQDLVGQYARWRIMLAEYDFDIVHRKGSTHINADVLSRYPRPTSLDVTGACLDPEASHLAMIPVINLVNYLSRFPCEVPSGVSVLDWLNTGGSIMVPGPVVVAILAAQAQIERALYSCATVRWAAQATVPHSITMAESGTDMALEQWSSSGQYQQEAELGEGISSLGQARILALSRKAAFWVESANQTVFLSCVNEENYMPWRAAASKLKAKQAGGPFSLCPDAYGVLPTANICTSVVSPTFFPNVMEEGVVLLELFGGVCAGLEMALRNGVTVRRYLYVDVDPKVRRVAAHRMRALSDTYPALFGPEAYQHAFTAFPAQDVWAIDSTQLVGAGACDSEQWLVVAGWECQDLSPAGKGKGLQGPRSNTFFALRNILGALQQLQAHKPPGYILENTYLHFDFGGASQVATRDFPIIRQSIGAPVAIDAAQFGSYAHRLRYYWTNLAHVEHVQAVLRHVERPQGLKVADVLLPGRTPWPVDKGDRHPFYVCNRVGEPRSAFPTFVAYSGSVAFKPCCAGSVFDSRQSRWTEPCPDEREVCMGYDMGSTAVPNNGRLGQPVITEKDRHVITGRAMDMNAMSSLLAICEALHVKETVGWLTGSSESIRAVMGCYANQHYVPLCPEEVGEGAHPGSDPVSRIATCVVNCAALAQEEIAEPSFVKRDIWRDPVLLEYVQTGALPDDLSSSDVKRLLRRAHPYQYVGGVLQRVLADGTARAVPAPEWREQIIERMHVRCGHFGEKRTMHLVLTSYWWYGLGSDVCRFVKGCELCRRVNLAFNAQSPQLQPLPIMGMFYRWGCDLCGPFVLSRSGNTYAMICVEYYSKHVELVCLPDKKAKTTATAFLTHVLSRFGSCAEVVTDQGTEWRDAFDTLLESCYIDHRVTSPNHPQSDGLAERVVQTLKKALRKHVEQSADVFAWDEGVPWIALGYRCSPQASTKLSPYQMLYARQPTVPPAIVQRMAEPIDFDRENLAAGALVQRARWVEEMCIEAGGNLLIAQHRDSLRYAMVRQGDFKPSLLKFFLGQFVYVQRADKVPSLQIKARPNVLRIVEFRGSDTVVLQGKCGATTEQHITNLAPCHLPSIDPTIDPTLQRPPANWPCEVCRFPNKPGRMLLCDNCNTGWHLSCLNPPLRKVPDGAWLCPYCVSAGVSLAEVEKRQAANEAAEAAKQPDVAPMFTKQRRRMLAEAKQLHGRYLIYPFPGPGKTKVYCWGRIEYLGDKHYPRCLRTHYEGGETYDVTLRGVRPYLMGVNSTPPEDFHINFPESSAFAVSRAQGRVERPPHLPLEAVPKPNLTDADILLPEVPAWHVDASVKVVSFAEVHHALAVVPAPGLHDLLSRHIKRHCLHTTCAAFTVDVCYKIMGVDFLSGYVSHHGVPDVVVCCLPRGMHDLVLQLACKLFSCVYATIPADFIRNAPEARLKWLTGLKNSGRLHVVSGHTMIDSRPLSVTWLCVFPSAAMRGLLVGDPYRGSSRSVVWIGD